jgi:hypothetical protein
VCVCVYLRSNPAAEAALREQVFLCLRYECLHTRLLGVLDPATDHWKLAYDLFRTYTTLCKYDRGFFASDVAIKKDPVFLIIRSVLDSYCVLLGQLVEVATAICKPTPPSSPFSTPARSPATSLSNLHNTSAPVIATAADVATLPVPPIPNTAAATSIVSEAPISAQVCYVSGCMYACTM